MKNIEFNYVQASVSYVLGVVSQIVCALFLANLFYYIVFRYHNYNLCSFKNLELLTN